MQNDHEQRVAAVTGTPSCVAFWDFVKREPGGERRFTAHVPAGAVNDFALDAMNYIHEFWGKGREATYADFPLLGRGPFGQAIQIRQETDDTFRPLLLVPRSRLHDSALDIKGPGKSLSMIVWAIRESGEHALAGIWHEGTDLEREETKDVRRVERGMRQYALFAGLDKEGAALGHVSDNGGSSFGCIWAHHRATTPDRTPQIPSNATAEVLDQAWAAYAFTFDNEKNEIIAYLNGVASNHWVEDVKNRHKRLYRAWHQGRCHNEPSFPADQVYTPPEDTPVAVQVISETEAERVEVREFRYTKVEVRLRKNPDGTFTETGCELLAARLNPWCFPHDVYTPPDAAHGGPFTIGRVIHSAAGVGFTGYIGGVAVFDRALSAKEVAQLSAIGMTSLVAAQL
jgi:hypothetical protein